MTCTLRVLGCSGGIGADLRTTSFLLNNNILIDAGTGVGDITLDEMSQIDYVFLTHSHLDHICSLPFMADAVGALRAKPLQIYGITATIDALKQHILNNVIWPDFTILPSKAKPFLNLNILMLGESIKIQSQADELAITALPVAHSIPANGYAITSGDNTLVFSGDTGISPELIDALNKIPTLQHLLIETSFNDCDEELAKLTGHFSPRLLLEELCKLKQGDLKVWVSHLKPDGGLSIFKEIIDSPIAQERFADRIQDLRRGLQIEF